MSQALAKTKPSFLEAGLPCASLSAECQRDNNARQRPPQNRLHIWWARRPPTICRAAILAALLPHDLQLDEYVLPPLVDEPTAEDLDNLPPKLQPYRHFFEQLLSEGGPTPLTQEHQHFLRAMGITGDAAAAHRRMAIRDEQSEGGPKIPLPDALVYRHLPAFAVSPCLELIRELLQINREMMQIEDGPLVVLDSMAGGGAIPLEAIRYGFKVYANELNAVASLILKATLEYPTRFGRGLRVYLEHLAQEINNLVRSRLSRFFSAEPEDVWWPTIDRKELDKLRSRQVVDLRPGGDAVMRDYLWVRTIPCSRCDLNIPLSTNFLIISKKGKPEASIAAFPVVPARGEGNDCTFHIVPRAEWQDCVWPRPGFERWDPRGTPTFKDGKAICPRCGQIIDGEAVKTIARSQEGGLAAQMYAVCSQVPVKLTYKNGDVKIRYIWRFRPPTHADLEAVQAAKEELARLRPRWEAHDLIPTEDVPDDMEDKRPREYGMPRWRDLFLPRQLLTNVVILEEIRTAQARARAELPEAEAEAVSAYMGLILCKVISYNSVQNS